MKEIIIIKTGIFVEGYLRSTMDNLLYFLLTNVISLLSLIVFSILITVHIVKKTGFKVLDYVICFFCIVGMYIYIPALFVSWGFNYQNVESLEKAKKLSVNPYEKRLCDKYLAEIYADDIFNQKIKDGNKAIDYMEKALKGEYKKYEGETIMLSYWYSIKGDYKKTEELNNILGRTKELSLRNIYIMNNEYKKAIDTFSEKNTSTDNFLKADLYKKIGNIEKSKETLNLAQNAYNRQISVFKTKSDKMKYDEKTAKYKSVEAYKDWLNEQKKEFKFQ